MALSFQSVQKAYKVFHELGVEHIPSWPDDMAKWTEEEKKNPRENTVYGWDKKYDDGWENLVFFVRSPSPEFKKKFGELKGVVPNSSISHPYDRNPEFWVFGWF